MRGNWGGASGRWTEKLGLNVSDNSVLHDYYLEAVRCLSFSKHNVSEAGPISFIRYKVGKVPTQLSPLESQSQSLDLMVTENSKYIIKLHQITYLSKPSDITHVVTIWLYYWIHSHSGDARLISGRCSVWVSARELPILTEAFHGFPQSLQANPRIVCTVGHNQLLPNSFQFIRHGNRHYICDNSKTSPTGNNHWGSQKILLQT
jgi:hypothetical protein